MKIKLSQAIWSIIYDFKNKKNPDQVGSQKNTLFKFVIQLLEQSSSQEALKKALFKSRSQSFSYH